MSVRLTPRARDDIARILEYLADRSLTGQAKVGGAIFDAIDLIGEFPSLGRLSEEQGTRVTQAGPYPYLIYWYAESGDAWIVHVRHAARRGWQGDE